MNRDKEFAIERGATPGSWILRGVMRLETAEAYGRAFAPLAAETAQGGAPALTLDLSGVVFLNSSGIRALADVLLAARENGRSVALLGSAAIPWQRKLATSFTGLFPDLVVRLDR